MTYTITSMSKITRIHAREILDSRGNPTIEVELGTKDHVVYASAPSGASTGSHEALELRDNDPRRFFGRGVLEACRNVTTTIARKLRGKNPFEQKEIDDLLLALDETDNKSNLGANAVLGVSMACAKLAALENSIPLFQYLNPRARVLPVPMMNVINGGKHADSGLDFQEFMIVPKGAPTFKEALRMGAEIFHALKNLLIEEGYSIAVGDEGGFAPKLKSHEEALAFLTAACKRAKHEAGDQVFFALDCAATEFYKNGKYVFRIEGEKKSADAAEMTAYYEMLCAKFPIISIEDGLSEDDWTGWRLLTQKLGNKIQLVGDDLFATDPKRLSRGFSEKAANAILIKLNQIGTVTETMEVVKMAKKHNYGQIVSHRSGETEETFIADFAVAMETGQIKTGSLSRTDRIAKYNQLLRIEEMLGRKSRYGG